MKQHKKVRLYVNGERQRDVYLNKTKFQIFKYKAKRFFKRLFITVAVLAIVIGIYKLGGLLNPATVYTKAEVIKEVTVKAPILDRIAKCESGNRHYDSNGQILVKGNVNKTVDVGRFQINNYYWGAKAKELGLDITREEDNRKMAEWIYENKGTEPWSSSKPCWNK